MVDHNWTAEHGGGGGGYNQALRDQTELVIQLTTDERNGWFTDESVISIKKMGALNIANMLIDEIEKNNEGVVDMSLDGVLDAPLMYSVTETGVLELGIVQDITIRFKGHRYARGTRGGHVITP